MRHFRKRPGPSLSDYLCFEVLTDWLTSRLSHAELVAEVVRLFRRRGPGLPRPLWEDLRDFLEDRSTRVLARCLAINEGVTAREDFVTWCLDRSAETDDAHARLGVRSADFCTERGPGAGRREAR